MSDLNALRRDILKAAYLSGTGHVPSSLSCLEIVHTLYTRVMRPDDVFILSKGHAALALYAVLGSIGELPANWPEKFCKPDSGLLGHPDKSRLDLFYAGGSLGHGIGYGIGAAIAKRLKGEAGRVFVLVGDGELQEGSSLEALRISESIANLYIIIDGNGTHYAQKGIADRFIFCDSAQDIETEIADESSLIWVSTVKGHGISAMEKDPQAWHHRAPNAEQYAEMLRELE